jgi:hypothetical protein
MVGSRRGQGCVEDGVSAQRYGAKAAAQLAEREGHPRGKSERGGGVVDRKDGTTEEIEEQRALYIRAKRRGAALPDRAGLNRKRQRTGSRTT